jgi:hypothetical protein
MKELSEARDSKSYAHYLLRTALAKVDELWAD